MTPAGQVPELRAENWVDVRGALPPAGGEPGRHPALVRVQLIRREPDRVLLRQEVLQTLEHLERAVRPLHHTDPDLPAQGHELLAEDLVVELERLLEGRVDLL